MTWGDDTSASTPTWTGSGSTSLTWTASSGVSALGNLMRFVDADALQDASGGIDFNNTFSTENPWVFTTSGPISFRSNREDPT